MTSIRPLIVGVDGLIGSALWSALRSEWPSTSGTSRRGTSGLPFLDLKNPDFHSIQFTQFTHVMIAGANPNIQNCESDPHSTSACNLSGPLRLAQVLSEKGVQPILFSTDYVFDGVRGGYSENDIPSPLNQYGLQKAELERQIEKVTCGNYLMIRLPKVFLSSQRGGGIIGDIADTLRRGQKVRAATDLIFSPILLDDVILGVMTLIRRGATGLYNMAGSQVLSRYDLSVAIGEKHGVDLNLIQPISLDELNEPFKRPKRTHLLSHKFEKATGIKCTGILDELFRYSSL